MGRSHGRLGWSGQAGGAVTPSELSDAYKKGQFWIPAGALTPTVGFPLTLETFTAPGGHYSWTVAKMPNDVKSGGCFTWAFKADFVDTVIANLDLKVAPIFFTKVDGDSPNDVIEWSLGAVNLLIGDDINIVANNETELLSIAQPLATPAGEMLINAGNAASKQNVPLTKLNDGAGTALSPTDWNFVTFNMEREADSVDRVADTFDDDVFLLGLAVQFSVDFNNVVEWPG